jgi:hypothetical protein
LKEDSDQPVLPANGPSLMLSLMKISNRVDASIVLDGESASSYSRKSEDFRPSTMNELNRRNFLLRAGTGFSAAWISANWPALLSAATHAHSAAKAPTPPKFEFFTPEEAAEIEAITARLIPTTLLGHAKPVSFISSIVA